MRIAQLNTFCGVKSTGRIACEIAKLVEKDGGVSRIFYGVPGISHDSESFAVRVGTKLERKIHAVIRKLLDAEGYGSFFATRKLIHQLKQFQPDVVHFHNLHGCYLHLPLLFRYLKKANVPVVWTLHDCWPFTGHCAYFDYSGCQRWKNECSACPQQKNYPVCIGLDGSQRNHRMKKRYFDLPDLTFVAPCHWMTGHLQASYLGHHPSKVIVNGVNLAVFHPVESDLRERYCIESKKVCLAVASEWDQRKGLPFLCEAANKMGESYCFVVIGLTEEQITTLPKSMIGIRNTANVHELAAWYTAADCLVNPTLEDNMPMVNLEALACGTPVVVFDTGGCPEAVDGSCGLVVPKGDVDTLCEGIQKVTRGGYDQKACIQRARAFDCQNTFQSYLALYKELCQ